MSPIFFFFFSPVEFYLYIWFVYIHDMYIQSMFSISVDVNTGLKVARFPSAVLYLLHFVLFVFSSIHKATQSNAKSVIFITTGMHVSG